jgi:hypothetical protein
MLTPLKRMGLAALASLANLSMAPVGAPAQGIRPTPITIPRSTAVSGPRQTPLNQGITGQVGLSSAPFAALFPSLSNPLSNPLGNAAAVTAPTNQLPALAGLTNPYAGTSQNPYGGGGYGSYYYETELGGYLRGTADVVTAQGKYLASLQQAGLLKEQTRQAAIETRRKSFDEYLYEREKTPTFRQERERVAQLELQRSLSDPSTSEIWSGQALNTLLADLAKRPHDETSGQTIALDEDLLRHINLTTGQGNVGLLKNAGRLSWPLALLGDANSADRELLNSLAPEAINQAVRGRVDKGTLKEMFESVHRIRRRLAADIKDVTPTQYVEAGRFLSNLDDALKVLSHPDAGDYFTRKYTAQGRTVAELVKHMTAQGLTFAPAIPGDGPAYLALHRALVAYDVGGQVRMMAEH